MISIRKYLMNAAESNQVETSLLTGDLLDLCSSLLGGIDQHVLGQKHVRNLRLQCAELCKTLTPAVDSEDIKRIRLGASDILTEYGRVTQQMTSSAVEETLHMVGMLNQALIVLARRSERSVSRLKAIQTSLEESSHFEDILSLKSSLTETMAFVQQEAVLERQAAAKEMDSLQQDVTRTRGMLAVIGSSLSGREEGIRGITEAVRSAPAEKAIYLEAFLIDRLQGVTQRYGPEVAEELMLLLLKERVQPLAPAGAIYRWTSASFVVAVLRDRATPAGHTETATSNHRPLVHQFLVGNRTAVLNVTPSHLVSEVTGGSIDTFMDVLDRFTGFR